jgi:uncharacterized protein (TIGR02996 family)
MGVVMREAEAFERAIIEHPDDLSSYSAYADWLQEHDDPLGEFIAVQLALEDESRPKQEREALKKRERKLLAANEGAWLGKLVKFLDPEEDEENPRPNVAYRWRRGFISELDAQCVTIELGQAIAACPAARILRELRIRYGERYHGFRSDRREARVPTPQGYIEHYGCFELLGSPSLRSVRVFRAGGDEDEPPEDGWIHSSSSRLGGLEQILISMPRLEELHLLTNSCNLLTLFSSPDLTRLRVLRVYHQGEHRGENRRYEYPLDVLAANPAFSNLTHLQFHPHYAEESNEDGSDLSYIPLEQIRALVRSPHLKKLTHLQLRLSDMGDDGVREIIASGILKQLKWLDLRHGCVTDEGARLLTAHPDAKLLERLDLSRNAVTAEGLAALRAAGVNAVANRPLTQGELESREYLREGDME